MRNLLFSICLLFLVGCNEIAVEESKSKEPFLGDETEKALTNEEVIAHEKKLLEAYGVDEKDSLKDAFNKALQ